MAEENQEKKIIIDEDWKSKVEAEKEAAREQGAGGESQPPADAAEKPADETGQPTEEAAQPVDEYEMPPASFQFLVTTFATQVLAALGQIPDPVEGKPVVRLSVARHFIDTLAILEEKTKGNLSPEEEQLLGNAIHELRMVFVSVKNSESSTADEN